MKFLEKPTIEHLQEISIELTKKYNAPSSVLYTSSAYPDNDIIPLYSAYVKNVSEATFASLYWDKFVQKLNELLD